MKKPVLLALSCLLFFILTARNITGRVTAIKDGDTIELLRDRTTYRIRLEGIDCPEKKQPYGNRAKQFVSDLCFGKTVTARISSQDRYGRYLAFIILSDGRNLNHELLRNGLAWHYKQYSKDRNLASLETQARQQRIGLWNDRNPTPPWEYRRRKRK